MFNCWNVWNVSFLKLISINCLKPNEFLNTKKFPTSEKYDIESKGCDMKGNIQGWQHPDGESRRCRTTCEMYVEQNVCPCPLVHCPMSKKGKRACEYDIYWIWHSYGEMIEKWVVVSLFRIYINFIRFFIHWITI